MNFRIIRGGEGCIGKCLTPAVYLFLSFILFFCISCGPTRRIAKLSSQQVGATIRLPTKPQENVEKGIVEHKADTMKIVGPDGKEMLLMQAVKDEESGEMIASDKIEAAYIVSRFRNVAERDGLVQIEFQLIVPESLQDSRWQLRLHPVAYMLNDSTILDDILITGKDYRKAQLRGYQQYERFISRIITDSTILVDRRNLELFISRNIPELYAFSKDSNIVSNEDFHTVYGLGYKQIKEHYTNWLLVKRNMYLNKIKDKKRKQYIKSEIRSEYVRLDTVRKDNGAFEYNYVQLLKSKPKLRKIELNISGELYEEDKLLYTIPTTEPLTFYVSSVSSFADESERYLSKVISRSLQIDESCIIGFEKGKSTVLEDLGNNASELEKIKSKLRQVELSTIFEIDSIVICASTSPEGSYNSNLKLSYNRSKSVSEYFSRFLTELRDSLSREKRSIIAIGDYASSDYFLPETIDASKSFVLQTATENWNLLDKLVYRDTLLSQAEKDYYLLKQKIEDKDFREAELKKNKMYKYLADNLYPQLRTVSFNFHLHRQGMIKDTVHTTILDTTYMQGVQALKDRDYETAIHYLSEYADYNYALACIALNRNATAMSILSELPESAKQLYLLAILYSRNDDEKRAIEHYLRAVDLDSSLIHRANLDPEIAQLKQKYNL